MQGHSPSPWPPLLKTLQDEGREKDLTVGAEERHVIPPPFLSSQLPVPLDHSLFRNVI